MVSSDKTRSFDAGPSTRPAVSSPEPAGRGPRGPLMLGCLALLAAVLFAGFMSLGVWQVKRLQWKLDLIAQVDTRVHADPVPAPGPGWWPGIENEAYQRVRLTGDFLPRETLVQANTDLGPGFWVMSPMHTAQGFIVLVNRGFVSPDKRDPASRQTNPPSPAGETGATVVGLLRQTEPGGGLLRENDEAGNRWYSRDVQAIVRAQGVTGGVLPVAPYFVDVGPTPPGNWPVGGLTVISFKNTHLIYALTWFGLALMVALAAWYVARVEQRLRRRAYAGNARTSGA